MRRKINENEFESILRKTQTQIRAYLAGIGVPTHDIDDVAQNVYVELYTHPEIPADADPLQWLKGIARKTALNYFRRKKNRQARYQKAVNKILLNTVSVFSEDRVPEENSVLEACLEKLPPHSRNLVETRYFRNITARRIAKNMKKKAEAVRVMLFRIRNELKDCIQKTLLEAQR